MSVEVIGIDHVYLAVRDLGRAEAFYDRLMDVLGFRKRSGTLAGEPHVHYYNRQFGFSLRPARPGTPAHDPYAPGLHHFCFRVVDEAAVDRAADALRRIGVKASPPRAYPEYAPDYYATFFTDPDGVRLEVTNFRLDRRRRMYDWDAEAPAPGAPRAGGRATGDVVDRPHAAWWIAIVGGLALCGLLGFSTAAYTAFATHVTAAVPKWLFATIFVVSYVLHLGEALYAHRLARQKGLNASAPAWAVQTFLIGFPSLRLLQSRAQSASAPRPPDA